MTYNVESSAAEKELGLQGAGHSTGKTETLRQKGLMYSWRDNQEKCKEEKQNGCTPW